LNNCESNDVLLAVGALIVEELRADIKQTLGYNCSAGIANSKTLAKLCAGLNKPNRQTILPKSSIESLYEKTNLNQVRNLGGKLGNILNEELNLKTMSDLAKMSLSDLTKRFGDKTGNWLNQISHGIDHEPVLSRQVAKSIGCSKNFRGKQALNTVSKVNHWLKQLSEELQERLDSDKERNQREANLLVVHITTEGII
jgi:DNA polymerase eta